MKKFLRAFLGVIIILIILLILVLLSMDLIAKKAVNEYVPQITKTKVVLGDISTSVIGTSLSLKDLFIGSPEGFSSPHILKLGRIDIEVDRDSLVRDVIVIKKINISDVSVIYELAGTKSNISALLDNISDPRSNKGKQEKEPSSPASSRSSKNVVIKELTITNAEVSLAASVALADKSASITLPIPNLTLRNIGDIHGGTSMDDALTLALDRFMNHTLKEIANSSFKNISTIGDKSIKGLKESIKGFFSK